uniref:C-type lectin domain-containing protein n=1 Tax=Chrysemys picta bellii TaxID=8478 RepID=A0A8C3HY56_CHRPI
GSPTSARCYKIALGALGACCIIRTLVIALGAWGKSINDLHLFPLPPAGGSRCKLCPRDWVLHGDKCYWLSNEADSWSMSHDDCSRKGSQMLVIQDRKQMVTYILCQGTERPDQSKRSALLTPTPPIAVSEPCRGKKKSSANKQQTSAALGARSGWPTCGSGATCGSSEVNMRLLV